MNFDIPGVNVQAPHAENVAEILTRDALAFVATLAREFEPQHRQLLQRRKERQAELDAGKLPDFLPQTRSIREADWAIAPLPDDLQDRRVEITGPVDRKMVINALNSGAKVFMADFEDSNSPTWANVLDGQVEIATQMTRIKEYSELWNAGEVKPMVPGDKADPKNFRILESMPVRSIITSPVNGTRLAAGARDVALRGASWAGDLTVKQIDVSIDYGQTWQQAKLEAPKNRYDWQRWTANVKLPSAGYFEVWARATDSGAGICRGAGSMTLTSDFSPSALSISSKASVPGS